MTKKYGNDVKYIKRRGRISKTLRRLFYFVFVLVVAISFGQIFAGAMVGNLNLHIFGQRDKVKVKKEIYYGIKMGEYTDLNDAKNTANIVSQAGGGGYVWQDGSKYVVLGSVYLNEVDCEKVVNNLSENFKASLYDITLKKCKFTIEDISKKEQLKIKDIVEFCNLTFEELYKISIDYDTGNISNIAVSAKSNSLKSKVIANKNQIDLLNIKYNSENLTLIYNALQSIEDILELLTNQMLTTENNLNLVKYAFIDILRVSFDLRNGLK